MSSCRQTIKVKSKTCTAATITFVDLRIVALKTSAHAALALFNCTVGRTLTYLGKPGFYGRTEKYGRIVELLNENLILSSKITYSPITV